MPTFRDKQEWMFSSAYLELQQEMPLDKVGILAVALSKYSLSGETVDVPDDLYWLYRYLCISTDKKQRAYDETIEQRRKNGKQGGAPKGNKNASKSKNNEENNQNNQNNRLVDFNQAVEKQPKQHSTYVSKLVSNNKLVTTASSPEGEPPEGFVDQTEWVKM